MKRLLIGMMILSLFGFVVGCTQPAEDVEDIEDAVCEECGMDPCECAEVEVCDACGKEECECPAEEEATEEVTEEEVPAEEGGE